MVATLVDQTQLLGLAEEQKVSFETLLEEFKDIFLTSNTDLGCDVDESHVVDTGNHPPIFQHAYQRSPQTMLSLKQKSRNF